MQKASEHFFIYCLSKLYTHLRHKNSKMEHFVCILSACCWAVGQVQGQNYLDEVLSKYVCVCLQKNAKISIRLCSIIIIVQ